MRSRWREFAIEWPARNVGHLWYGYWLIPWRDVALVTTVIGVPALLLDALSNALTRADDHQA